MAVEELRSRNIKIRVSSRGVLYLPLRMFQKMPGPNLLLICSISWVIDTIMLHTSPFFSNLWISETATYLNITLMIRMIRINDPVTTAMVYKYGLSWYFTLT